MTNKATLVDNGASSRSKRGAQARVKSQFREQQRYSSWPLVGLIVFLLAGLSYRVLDQHLINPVPTPVGLLPYTVLTVLLLGALVYLIKVRIFVFANDSQICVSRFPWKRRPLCIKWQDVVSCEVVRTPLLAQWSGSNIRLDHEKVYSACGRNGLHLTTRDGEKVFIGTRRLDELEVFVQEVL